MPLPAGTRLGPYEIVGLLGAGGMGEVYEADDPRLGRRVALKVIRSDAASADQLARFTREARSVAALSHPNILTVFDVGEEKGTPYIVTELLEGESLRKVAARRTATQRQLIEWAVQAAHGLAAAHEKGIVHRDLKPENVFVTATGRVKILDFGLAKLAADAACDSAAATDYSPTTAGVVIGTLPYLSPEQAEGCPADARSDLFSFGVVLYELLSGKHPFRRETPGATLAAILRDSPPPPSSLDPSIPPVLDDIIARCLEKPPGERFQSANDLAWTLEAVLSASKGPALSGEAGAAAILRSSRSRPAARDRGGPGRRLAWACGAAAVVLAGGFVWWTAGRSRTDAGIRSIAVLPLANLSADRNQDYFADGITEELVTELARINSVRVLSRVSTLRYRGSTRTVPEIARELGVDAVVEGSVQRVGGQVRVAAQLIRTAPERHLWARTYEASADDLFGLRTRIAEEIVRQVGARLPKVTRTPRPVPAAAHDAYLQGWSLTFASGGNGWALAIPFYERAIALDPGFALAHAELAEAHAMLDFGADLRGEHFERAKELARRTLELDPDLPEARIRDADLKFYWDWDWSQCENGFGATAELSPGSFDTRLHYATCLNVLGRNDEAVRETGRALELEPLNTLAHTLLGGLLLRTGRSAEAIGHLRRVTELRPAEPGPHRRLGNALLAASRGEEALATFREAGRLDQDPPESLDALSDAFRRGGLKGLTAEVAAQDRRRATRRLSSLEADARGGRVDPVALASVHASLGDLDRAFELLDEACRQRRPALVWLKSGDTWEPLRGDPRYAALLRRMKFPV